MSRVLLIGTIITSLFPYVIPSNQHDDHRCLGYESTCSCCMTIVSKKYPYFTALKNLGFNESLIELMQQHKLSREEILDMNFYHLNSMLGVSIPEFSIMTCNDKTESISVDLVSNVRTILSELMTMSCNSLRCGRQLSDPSSASISLDTDDLLNFRITMWIERPPSLDSSLLVQHFSLPDASLHFHAHSWLIPFAALTNFQTEQHNGQRRALTEVLHILSVSNSIRGLIEPVFIFQPRNSSLFETMNSNDPQSFNKLKYHGLHPFPWRGATYHVQLGIMALPASGILDMPTLAQLTPNRPVLPYREFLRLSNLTLDQLLVADPVLAGNPHLLPCDPAARAPWSEGPLVGRPELLGRLWEVRRARCLPFKGPVAAQVAEALEDPGARVVGLCMGRRRLRDGDHWDDLNLGYLRARAHLRPSHGVVTWALAYLAWEFCMHGFVAVHWRRGDKLKFGSEELSPEWQDVAEAVARACELRGLHNVFVMTNSGSPSDVRALEEALENDGLWVAIGPGWLQTGAGVGEEETGPEGGRAARGWEWEDRGLAVELAVASLADHFLASPSSVSSTILEERVLLGQPSDSWGHIIGGTGFSWPYDRHFDAMERELAHWPDLDRAVAEQAGAAPAALDCVWKGGRAGDCAEGLVRSFRRLAADARAGAEFLPVSWRRAAPTT